MTFSMTAGHLAPAGGGFEPQRVNQWVAIIPGLGDTELTRLSIERISLPRISTAVIHMRYLNEDVKVPGGAVVDQNSIVVRDFVDRPTWNNMNAWMEACHNTTSGAIGFAAEIKKQMTILLLDPHGDPVRQIDCKGVWPSAFSGAADLDYTILDQYLRLTMVLQVDKYRIAV